MVLTPKSQNPHDTAIFRNFCCYTKDYSLEVYSRYLKKYIYANHKNSIRVIGINGSANKHACIICISIINVPVALIGSP